MDTHRIHKIVVEGEMGWIARSWSCWIWWVVSLGASAALRPCRVSLLTAPARPWPLPPRALGLPQFLAATPCQYGHSRGSITDAVHTASPQISAQVPARHAHQSWCCIPAVDALGRALGDCFAARDCGRALRVHLEVLVEDGLPRCFVVAVWTLALVQVSTRSDVRVEIGFSCCLERAVWTLKGLAASPPCVFGCAC
jgi:hypothetical protein